MFKKENKTRDGESAEEDDVDAIGVNGEECDGDVDHFWGFYRSQKNHMWTWCDK